MGGLSYIVIAQLFFAGALCLFGNAIAADQSVKTANVAGSEPLDLQVVLGVFNAYRLGPGRH